MKPRQAMKVRAIAGASVLALLLQTSAFTQEPAHQPNAVPQASTTQTSGDQIPDSPGAVQSRLILPPAMTPDSSKADRSKSFDTDAAPTASEQSDPSSGPSTTTQPSPPQQQQQIPHEPVGTAAAESIQTTGVAASRPAGAAVAPGKQRRARSIIIKVGAVLGVGAAVATTWALSQGSPSKPPGSH